MTRKEGQRRRRRAYPEELGGFGFLTGSVRAAVMVGITLVIFLTYIASQPGLFMRSRQAARDSRSTCVQE